MHLKICPVSPDLKNLYENHGPKYEGDAGYDLYTPEEVIIPAKSSGSINYKVKIAAFENRESDQSISYMIVPRSSIAKTPLRLSNCIGIIDSGFRGELVGCFDNISDEPYKISKNTRHLQIVSFSGKTITSEIVDVLPDSHRGIQCYGSSGV